MKKKLEKLAKESLEGEFYMDNREALLCFAADVLRMAADQAEYYVRAARRRRPCVRGFAKTLRRHATCAEKGLR